MSDQRMEPVKRITEALLKCSLMAYLEAQLSNMGTYFAHNV